MKLLFQKNKVALLESQQNYIVAIGFKDNYVWEHGYYFTLHRPGDKAEKLSKALDFFRYKTEEDYITRTRLEELATKFKDGLFEADCEYAEEFIETEMDLTHMEKEWLGIEEKY
jgi:hypothetical protein